MGSGLINILHNCKLKLKLISIIWFAHPALLNVNVMFYMKCWGIILILFVVFRWHILLHPSVTVASIVFILQ
jgi:hypothetical protein